MLFFMLNYLYLGFLPLIVSKMHPVVDELCCLVWSRVIVSAHGIHVTELAVEGFISHRVPPLCFTVQGAEILRGSVAFRRSHSQFIKD